jgi:Transport and Golgi organisation 2
MCTVLLRYAPGAAWPLLVAAVRDEFLERPWDPPATHWPSSPSVIGGRDRTAGGTWLAVDRDQPAIACLLNGVRLPVVEGRPTRGTLPLAALRDELPASFEGYDGFHLMRGTLTGLTVWSWDGETLVVKELDPGDHILVNLGVDTMDDPLVPHFTPLLAALPDPTLPDDWGGWPDLLMGDGLDPGDDAALLVRKTFEDRTYGSSSATLVGLSAGSVRYDFTPTPLTPHWSRVL